MEYGGVDPMAVPSASAAVGAGAVAFDRPKLTSAK